MIYEEKGDGTIYTFLRKMSVLLRPYRRRMVVLAVLMIVVGAIDAVFPLFTRYAVDTFVVPREFDGIGSFALVYAGIALLQSINVFALIALAGKIEMGLSYDMRQRAFSHLQELSLSYYDKTPAGWIVTRLTSDIERLGETISWGLVDLVWGVTMMAAIAFVMLMLNIQLGFAVLTVMIPLLCISIYFQRKILKTQRTVRSINSEITRHVNEGIAGARTTKTLVLEDDNLRDFSGLTSSMYRASVRSAHYTALYLPAVLSIGSIGTAIALTYGGRLSAGGVITFGTVVAFISYTIQFFEPVRELARVLAELQSAQASAERVFMLLETKPEVTDSEEVQRIYGTTLKPQEHVYAEPAITGEIEFRNVSFRYKDNHPYVLRNFSLYVQPGSTVALVGETGSGKSTIVNVLCRFYELSSGEIVIDGTEYRKRSQRWLHSQIGYVLQSPHLFTGTIMENIRFDNEKVTDEMVYNAARTVKADTFISNLSEGYETQVGEGGGILSTGEKQLISFARAIAADPAIFILDEATSSIDTGTEMKVKEAIETILHNRTSFIIAHRLSTIKKADCILVLRRGVVVERGTHEELLSARGYYYALHANQLLTDSA